MEDLLAGLGVEDLVEVEIVRRTQPPEACAYREQHQADKQGLSGGDGGGRVRPIVEALFAAFTPTRNPSRSGRDPSILETPTALATPSTTSVPKVAAMGQDKCKLSVRIEHKPLDVHAPGCVAIEEDGIIISPKTVSQPTNGPGEDHLTR